MEVPQIEYIDHHMHVPVQQHRHVPMVITTQKFDDVPQVQVIDKVVEVPVQKHVQVPLMTRVQKPVEVPQIECIDQHIHAPVQKHVHVPMVRTMQEFVEVPQLWEIAGPDPLADDGFFDDESEDEEAWSLRNAAEPPSPATISMSSGGLDLLGYPRLASDFARLEDDLPKHTARIKTAEEAAVAERRDSSSITVGCEGAPTQSESSYQAIPGGAVEPDLLEDGDVVEEIHEG